ncbi:MAG: hypothetical protein KDD67_13645 [Ignavibacteriae bacterium]|nr:hypothetical protein [Ignavibacteriota bacterium]MCB9216168.1 hypothetical protein [Ignavibacteria bacterium]
MSGKNIFGLIVAIIVGIVVFRIFLWIIGAVWALAGWVIAGLIIGGVAYLAYKKFNNMLSSGKRLT